jgi:hypothetical protein
MSGYCPVLASNYPACGCPEGDCDAFDEFGMACDNCDAAGHRDAQGWTMNKDGSVWCLRCSEGLGPYPAPEPREVGIR